MYAVRRFQDTDAEAVSALIIQTLRTSNIKDYSAEYIENDVEKFTSAAVRKRAGRTHFYVVCAGDAVVGCGAIGPYWGKADESSLFNIFVLPEYQGKGIGRLIMETLEQDEFFCGRNGLRFRRRLRHADFTARWAMLAKMGLTQSMMGSCIGWKSFDEIRKTGDESLRFSFAYLAISGKTYASSAKYLMVRTIWLV